MEEQAVLEAQAAPAHRPWRPSRWFYLLAVAVALAGVALVVTAALAGLRWSSHSTRVVVPSRTAIAFPEGGRYLVAYEYRSVVDGRVYSTPQGVPPLDLELVGPDGRRVPIGAGSGSFTYQFGTRAGMTIAGFKLERPGRYVLGATYRHDEIGPNLVLAIGHDPLSLLLPRLIGGLVLILLVAPLTGGLVAFLRNRRKVLPVTVSSLPLPLPPRPDA